MSNANYTSPSKRDIHVNLDHLIISVQSRTSKRTDHALNEFISKEGRKSERRSATDFDYNMFRDLVIEKLNIDNYATLYPSLSNLVHVTSQASFHRCLTQIQKGEVQIHHSDRYKLPYLELSTRRNNATTQNEDKPLPSTPTRSKPPVEPAVPIIDLTQEPEANPAGDQNPEEKDDPKEPIIDLTQESEEVPEADPAGDQPERQAGDLNDDEQELYPDDGPTFLDAIAPREDSAGDEDWQRVCEFFGCDVNAEKIPVAAFTVWRIFQQVTEKNLPSFIIGDAPGLGKTGMSLTVAIIFGMVRSRYQDMLNERKSNQRPTRHLGRRQSSGRCPSQPQGVICPCVPSGLSNKIVQYIEDFPSLFCVPPILIDQWCDEADKWIDRGRDSPARDIHVHVHQVSTRADKKLLATDIQRIKGQLRQVVRGRQRKYVLDPQPGSSSHIIIISRNRTQQLLDSFKQATRTRGARSGVQASVNTLACGFMFFDEYHNYKGGRTSETLPFKLLGTIREMVGRVMAIGLSASVTKGPEYWRPFVDHVFKSAEKGPIDGLNNTGQLDQYATNFAFLVENTGRQGMEVARREELNERRENLREFMNRFIPQMMLARTRTSDFRGKPIGSRYGRIRRKNLEMLPGETFETFRRLASSVQSYFKQRLDDAIRLWEENGRNGDRPVKSSIVTEMVAENGRNRNQNEQFSIISRASCFPYIVTLRDQNLVPSGSLLVDGIKDIAGPISRLLDPRQLDAEAVIGKINDVNNLIAQSPFHPYRDELRRQSPKILFVEEYIRELLEILGRPAADEDIIRVYGPAPPDGTNARHALIFSQAPIGAFLTFMTLWHVFRNQIRNRQIVFLYAHSAVDTRLRAQYAKFMQQSCENDMRCKVLITTSGIFGEGNNFQRVNTVILTEVPSSYDIQKQSFGRVDRQGQTMTPFLYQLYDGLNLAERVKMIRNQNRKRIITEEQDDWDEVFPDS
ncbi:hypothetical protein F4801DRAFT_588621 [Xylaria longipes]|nr:hypothetical protein F4801DRAFT_588621 [Xylaria longipes]